MKITCWLASLFLHAAPSGVPIHPEKPAVVLVHGIFDSEENLTWLASQFASQGYETWCPSLTPSTGSASLPELSRQLDQKIHARFPADRPLHLIGFSMGGLITRHWLLNHADLDRITSFTTISSPHHGTALAWLLPGAGVRDMRFGSAFLRELQTGDERLRPLHPLSLYTALDLMIVPAQSSVWPVATTGKYWLPAHPLMIYSPSVCRRLLAHCQSRER